MVRVQNNVLASSGLKGSVVLYFEEDICPLEVQEVIFFLKYDMATAAPDTGLFATNPSLLSNLAFGLPDGNGGFVPISPSLLAQFSQAHPSPSSTSMEISTPATPAPAE